MNKLLKFLTFNKEISVSVLETTDMVNDAISIHKLSPVCAAALGRTMTVSTFMSSNLKSQKDKLYVTVAGDGLGGKISVCGNGELQMRGTIENPQVDIPLNDKGKLDVALCVGKNGRITITKSMGLKEPYSGSAKIVTGEIAEDFTSYYALSEQIPTAIALGVKIGKQLTCVGAGGVIIQALPFASEKSLQMAEDIMKKLSSVSTLIEKGGAEGIVKEFFGEVDYQTYYPKYQCLCSRDNIERILISLGKEELQKILEEEKTIKVNCEFCGKTYEFNQEEIDKLF